LYQLGYVTVTGAASDANADWHVIWGRFDAKGEGKGGGRSPTEFDLPANQGEHRRFNYVGNQGYYNISMIVDPFDYSHIYVGGARADPSGA
jgi:hypothetical protein